MVSGRASSLDGLPSAPLDIVTTARRAFLATVDAQGRPHLLPIGFAIEEGRILSAVDQKPKSGRRLARLRHIDNDPTVTVTFDRWDEDWTKLGWVMVRGRATIESRGMGFDAFRARYPQYGAGEPSGEVIAVAPEEIVWWMWGDGADEQF